MSACRLCERLLATGLVLGVVGSLVAFIGIAIAIWKDS